ncbi:MAG: SAM-dependent DNA methyltransferase [Spirochaetes bacterium]|nr:SAM-dependent DNA methyltransferase [Spirochaetota bacterium]
MKKTEKQVISKKRVSDHGEVYTASREVNAMLDLVKQETERIDSRFLEPACGTGNFLAEVLERKLKVVKTRYGKSQLEYERYSVTAVSSLYGIDILEDNVIECRKRLFDIYNTHYIALYKEQHQIDCCNTVLFLLEKNIIWGDALTLKTVCGNLLPIVFSEWSPVNGSMIKRRDFTLANLVNTHASFDNEPNLFSDMGESVAIPKPIKEYPLIHFLRLADAEE